VRALNPSRFYLPLIAAILFIGSAAPVCAQDYGDDVPLGDVARTLRRQAAPSETVIDNDNLSRVMEDVETRRAADPSLLFSLDPGSNSFHVSSPDVTCSLSFSANSSSLLSDPVTNELPRTELAKLDGPASIDGDTLQVTVHNGSSWELREVVVGLTIIRARDGGSVASYHGNAKIIPAVAGTSIPAQDSSQKQPDVTVLLHMKGSAAPSSTATFRTSLNFELFPDQEWHWAIVRAKGIPPETIPGVPGQPEQSATGFIPAVHNSNANSASGNTSSSNPSLPNSPALSSVVSNPSALNPPPPNDQTTPMTAAH
jgi:hypothetical protein